MYVFRNIVDKNQQRLLRIALRGFRLKSLILIYLVFLFFFMCHRTHSMNRVDKKEAFLNTLPIGHQNSMIKYRDHLFRIRNCIGNGCLFNEIEMKFSK